MSFYYSDDPIFDAHRHFDDLEDEYENGTKCTECGQLIPTDQCYVLNGKPYCDECIYIGDTEDYRNN